MKRWKYRPNNQIANAHTHHTSTLIITIDFMNSQTHQNEKKNHYISSLSNVCVWLDLLRCAISYYYNVIKHINIRLPEKKVNEYIENSIIFFWISRSSSSSFISIDQTWWWMIIDDWLVSTLVGAGIELNNRTRK